MKKTLILLVLAMPIAATAGCHDQGQRLRAQLEQARAQAARAEAVARRAQLQAQENERRALAAKKLAQKQLKKAQDEINKLKKLLAGEKARSKKLSDELEKAKKNDQEPILFFEPKVEEFVNNSFPAQKKKPRKRGIYTDEKEAGADFQIQGEYVGTYGAKGKYGVQVVALGNGKFDVHFLGGGLPGDGWDGKTRFNVQAARSAGAVVPQTGGILGKFHEGKFEGITPNNKAFAFKRIVRRSTTENAKPPKGALVLFDGTNADHWRNCRIIQGKYLHCGTRSVKPFGLGTYHIEFRTPFRPTARGQGRGNSGAYIMGREIQILDSFGLEGKRNECGAYYGRAKPRINMCFPPLSWQTFDVVLKADEKGQVVATVRHNGVVVHENFRIGRNPNQPATINLQNHGNPVWFRNIWFVAAESK